MTNLSFKSKFQPPTYCNYRFKLQILIRLWNLSKFHIIEHCNYESKLVQVTKHVDMQKWNKSRVGDKNMTKWFTKKEISNPKIISWKIVVKQC